MKHSNKLYEPIQLLPPCVCPKCYKPSIAYVEKDTICARLDEDGVPCDLVCNTETVYFCLSCGFATTDYIITDSGYRYNPFDMADSIREANKSLTTTRMKGNPFVKEF